jgi:uncharacterized protein
LQVDVPAEQIGFIPPRVDADSEAWWAEVEADRFALPVCDDCGKRWFPPMPTCPYDGSRRISLAPARPEGVVYSWIVVNRALHPAFAPDAPYVIATIDLADGARMFGRLFIDAGDVSAGMRVKVHFYTADGWRLVGFTPGSDPEI